MPEQPNKRWIPVNTDQNIFNHINSLKFGQ